MYQHKNKEEENAKTEQRDEQLKEIELRLKGDELRLKEDELRLKEIDIEIKRIELELKRGDVKYSRFLRFSPLTTTLITALVGLIGSGLIYFQGLLGQKLERDKFLSQQTLERQKLESSLILEAAKSTHPEQVAKNIRLLLEAGFIQDVDGKIKAMTSITEKETPILPKNTNPANKNE